MRIFPILLASVLALAVSLSLGIGGALPVHATNGTGNYTNADIATKALNYVGMWGGNACRDAGKLDNSNTGTTVGGYGAGQCRTFVNCIVYMVSGGTQYPAGSDYFTSFTNAGATEITSLDDLVKGDIVQDGQGTHTFIIVSRSGTSSTFNVVDSNHALDEKVMNYNRTVTLDLNNRAFRMAMVSGGNAGGSTSTADGTRIAVPGGQQYVWERGVTMAVGYGDAVAYDHEGNPLASSNTNWSGALNNLPLPANTMLRPVGAPQQYLWNAAGQLQPVNDGPTSQCLFASFTQSNPTGQLAIAPSSWVASAPLGPAAQCSLGDGVRFLESDTGGQQYVSIRGGAFPLGYGDALAYDGEHDSYNGLVMPAGYIQQPIQAQALPTNTVLRTAMDNHQYFWDGAQLHSIGDTPTSQCLLYAFPQNGIAVIPPGWMNARAQGAAEQCSLPDGTRFIETDMGGQQFVSVRGAALPVGYGDAQAYDAEGSAYSGLVMQAGYVQNPIHAPVLPTNTVLRAAGAAQQYFWDGQLHAIANPTISACLLSVHPQNGVAVVPPGWETTLPQGSNATC